MQRIKYLHQDLVMAVILCVMGVLFFVGSFFIPDMGNPVADIRTFPQLASGALIVFSFFNIRQGWQATVKLNAELERDGAKVPEISLTKLKYPVLGFIGVLTYAAAVSILGFFVSTGVFMIAAIWLLGYRKLWVILLTTFGMEIFIYLLFVSFLHTRMPEGLLF